VDIGRRMGTTEWESGSDRGKRGKGGKIGWSVLCLDGEWVEMDSEAG